MKKITKVWWHIISNDGSYLSHARFGTKDSALREMSECPKSFPEKEYHPVEVTYTYEIPEA